MDDVAFLPLPGDFGQCGQTYALLILETTNECRFKAKHRQSAITCRLCCCWRGEWGGIYEGRSRDFVVAKPDRYVCTHTQR